MEQNIQNLDFREAKGARLFGDGAVLMADNDFWVQSETDLNIVYLVQDNKCECPDFERRLKPCKHLWSVEYYFRCNGVNA